MAAQVHQHDLPRGEALQAQAEAVSACQCELQAAADRCVPTRVATVSGQPELQQVTTLSAQHLQCQTGPHRPSLARPTMCRECKHYRGKLTSTIMCAKECRLRLLPRMPWTSTAVGTFLDCASDEKRTKLPLMTSKACNTMTGCSADSASAKWTFRLLCKGPLLKLPRLAANPDP